MGYVPRQDAGSRLPPEERTGLRAALFLTGMAAWALGLGFAFSHRWLAVGVSVALALLADRASRVWSRKAPIPFPHSLRALLFFPRPFLSPKRIRRALLPRPGERVLEVGAGVGIHALPIAEALLPSGTLEAIDVQQQMLDVLDRRAARYGLTNVLTRQADARRLPYPDCSFDAAYLIGVLGEIQAGEGALRELRRVLKDDGRLLVGEVLFDPDFIPASHLVEMSRNAGFALTRKSGPGFAYYAVFQPAWTPSIPQPTPVARAIETQHVENR